MAQSAGAVKYIYCISAEEEDSHNKCPGYDTKQSDVEDPVMLKLWGTWGTPLLPSLSDPQWPGVVAPNRILSVGQIKLIDI